MLYLLIALLLTSKKILVSACPVQCRCDGNAVDCSNALLEAIPDGIPATTSTLILHGNLITSINKADIAHLRFVFVLTLAGNRISYIEPGAFSHMGFLTHLRLQNNLLSQITSGMFSGLSKLMMLALTGADQSRQMTIEDGAFSSLSNVDTLELEDNGIHSFTNQTFIGMSSLKVLKLSGNNISSIPPGSFLENNLITLHLLSNPLECCCDLITMVSTIQEVSGTCAKPTIAKDKSVKELTCIEVDNACKLSDAITTPVTLPSTTAPVVSSSEPSTLPPTTSSAHNEVSTAVPTTTQAPAVPTTTQAPTEPTTTQAPTEPTTTQAPTEQPTTVEAPTEPAVAPSTSVQSSTFKATEEKQTTTTFLPSTTSKATSNLVVSKTDPPHSEVAKTVSTVFTIKIDFGTNPPINPSSASTTQPKPQVTVTPTDNIAPTNDLNPTNDNNGNKANTITPTNNGTSACESISCLNGGQCEIGESGASCKCTDSYTGEFCAVNRGASVGDTNEGVADWIVALAVVACVCFLAFIALVIVLTNRRRRSYSPQGKDPSKEEGKLEEEANEPGPSASASAEEDVEAEETNEANDNPVYENID